MTTMIKVLAFLTTLIILSCNNAEQTNKANDLKGMIIRMSEIEIDTTHLDEYKTILKEEAEASVRLEPGVISIYPMQQQEDPTQVRILEIYANEDAYKAHLKTPHFQKYKTTTLKMVKSLRLVDMEAMDVKTMSSIFRKVNE
jgi:quinol monooxygenase YgiN